MKTQPTQTAYPYQNPLYLEPLHLGGIDLRPVDLLEHVLATGGTGSGKTRSFVLPLLEAVLGRFGKDQSSKAGVVLIDAKGDMSELAGEAVRRAGRTEDLHVLGEGGNCWYALFEQFGGDPTAIANFLHQTLEDRGHGGLQRGGGSNESFWEENALRLLRSSVILAKARHGDSLDGLQGIAEGIDSIIAVHTGESSDSYSDSLDPDHPVLLDALLGHEKQNINDHEHAVLRNYLMHDVCGGNPRTWSTIANMARNYIAQFSQPDLQSLFRPSHGKKRVTPEDVIDKGIILIVSLSPVIYGQASTPFRMAVKKGFCERVLQRAHLCSFVNGEMIPINQVRPILYICDEFHTTLNSKGPSADAYFLDRAREFRCMCVLATQGISAIQSVIGQEGMCDHLLNNCRTKFFFANDCPQTSRYFESIGGEEDTLVKNHSYVPRVAPPRFRLPNHEFSPIRHAVESGWHLSNQRVPKFSSVQLGSLPNGSALVVGKGRELMHFKLDPRGYALETMPAEETLPN